MARRLITYKSHANTGKWGALYDNIRTQGIGDFEFIALDIPWRLKELKKRLRF